MKKRIRIWKPIGNYFVYPDTISLLEIDRRTTSWSTGVFTKDNEELFEGDLFKTSDGHNTDVIYRVWEVLGGFAINTHVKMWQKDIQKEYPFPLEPLADEQTVSWINGSCYKIGNIYANPELLNVE